MSYVLTVYSQSAYKDFLLPAVIDANYTISLNKELFQLAENTALELENLGGRWQIMPNSKYKLVYTDNRQNAFGQELQNNDILSLTASQGERITVIVKSNNQLFSVFNKYDIRSLDAISIGKAANNMICYDFMSLVSQVHAVILRKGEGHVIEDRSANGLFVNAKRVAGSQRLAYGDLINVFGLAIVYLGEIIAFKSPLDGLGLSDSLSLYQESVALAPMAANASDCLSENGSWLFHRSPRYLPKLACDTVKIEAPPAPKEANRQPLLLAIGPSLTMALPMLLGCSLAIYASGSGSGGGAFMYTGLITAISSALIGTLWTVLNLRQAKKQLREDELKRFEAYGEYLINCSNEVQERYKRNTDIMRQLYVEAAVCCQYNHTSLELWNRNRNHNDFFQQRLGIGEIPFQVNVEIPQERFSMINDSLAGKARMIKDNYAMLQDVPVCADFSQKIIGLIGGSGKKGCYPVMYNLASQLAASACYTDVKMAFIYNGQKDEANKHWGFARWLPHVWSEDKRIRYVADNSAEASDVFYEIVKVLRMRAESNTDTQKVVFKPHYVLFIEDDSMLEGELISAFLLDKRDLGVTVVLLAENYENLPNACEYIIENTQNFQGVYGVTDPVEERQKILFDKLLPQTLADFSRQLSGIQVNEIEMGGELPNTLSFMEMYGVHRLDELNVLERWRKNRTYDSIKGLLGQKSGGAPCYLDVHEKYHGPHGLIAGTTGSGKSETLQTYMLSLAINYSPDDVGFFVIDYKGGGMANLFSSLPHLIGQISNLSGNQVHRAMVSIKSENVRRQRIFNEHGVNNINHYTRMYKNGEAALPVPHMFIIIDEFAELKREEPDFMKELISVAQVGRSLGVHLILATQKPSGTVDDNIWSNSKFRLCLRVQDQQDSKDMLHKPDAAYITQAGRCYLQVGNDELFELFQSGWSGAVYDEEDENSATDIATMLSINGKEALIGSHTKIKKKEQEKIQWISCLLDIFDSLNDDSTQVIENQAAPKRLLDSVFAAIAGANWEYPRSDYNEQRLLDLLHIYAEAKRQGWRSMTERANLVINLAAAARRKLPEIKKKTQLEAVVEYLGSLAEANGYIHNLQLWLPVLPTMLYLQQLEGWAQKIFADGIWPQAGAHWDLEVLIGLCDDPVNQAQMPLVLDFANNGHLALCGTVASGKSTFLVSMLYALIMRYSPQQLNIYALDFSSKMLSAFEKTPQMGGVLYEEDGEKIGKLFTMLNDILEERKILLRGGNYRQFVQAEAGESGNVSNTSLPAIMVVIDNYSAFRAKTDNGYDDFLLKLSKEGVSCGIFLVLTAMGFSMNEIPSRLGENIRTVICLEMTDKFAYSDALRTLHLDVLPEENVKGRGLAKVGESFLEFQTALALEAENDFKRGEEIQKVCLMLNESWHGRRVRRIPEIPAKPTWAEFAELESVAAMQSQGNRLPIGYDQKNAAVYGIDLRKNYCYVVSGKARTGKTNLLRLMMLSAAAMPIELVIVDFAQEFAVIAEKTDARYITNDQELFTYLVELQNVFVERNRFKKERLAAGDTDEELYDNMQQYKKILIMLGSLEDFVEHAENPAQGVEPMAPFLANLLDKGLNHNVYWFAGLNQDNHGMLTGHRLYDLFVRDKAGLHFGGNVEEQRIMDFDYLKFNERTKSLKPGIAMLPQNDEETTQRVVIPLCRR